MKRMLYGLLALTLALLLAGCAQKAEVVEAPELLEPVGVKVDTAVVERGDLFTLSSYEGSLVAAAEELSFEIDGQIKNVFVWPGKHVEAGDVLFELERRLDISSYNANDQRVFGFVSERLLDVWLLKNNVKCREMPYIFLEKQNWITKIANFLKRKMEGGKAE